MMRYLFIPLVLCALFVGCKKDMQEFDELYIYTAPGDTRADINNSDFVMMRNIAVPMPNSGFPVVITRPFTEEVVITGQIREELLASYDSINGVDSPELPEGLFSLNSNTVTIPVGQSSSVDSFYVNISDIGKLPSGISQFVVPVEVKSDNSKVKTSEVRQVMYVNVNLLTALSSPKSFDGGNTINVAINYTPINVSGPDKITFGGFLNRAIPKNAEVTIELASNLEVDQYNESHQTKYKYFPSGAYNLEVNKTTIPAGSVQSSDSFVIRLSDKEAFEKDSSYLLILQTKDEGVVAPDPNSDKVYVIVTGAFTNIDLSNTSTPASLLSRDGWKVAGFGGQTYGAANNVLDNNYNTSWMNSISSAWIAIDMGEVTELSGIQLSPNYAYGVQYNTRNFDIYTSDDGVDWVKQGTYSGNTFGGSTGNPDIRNIHFYGAIAARYFRINYLNVNSSGYAGASEIRGF